MRSVTRVAAFDYPETVTDLTAMAQHADLPTFRLVNRHTQHQTLLFSQA